MTSIYTKTSDYFLQALIAAPTKEAFAKLAVVVASAQIIADIDAGYVDHSAIKSFADLHDFEDANEYGGFCDDEVAAAADKLMPRNVDKDSFFSEEYLALIADVQAQIHTWILSDAFKNIPQQLA